MRRTRYGENKKGIRPASLLPYVTAIVGASANGAYRTMSSRTYCVCCSKNDRPRPRRTPAQWAAYTVGSGMPSSCLRRRNFSLASSFISRRVASVFAFISELGTSSASTAP